MEVTPVAAVASDNSMQIKKRKWNLSLRKTWRMKHGGKCGNLLIPSLLFTRGENTNHSRTCRRTAATFTWQTLVLMLVDVHCPFFKFNYCQVESSFIYELNIWVVWLWIHLSWLINAVFGNVPLSICLIVFLFAFKLSSWSTSRMRTVLSWTDFAPMR